MAKKNKDFSGSFSMEEAFRGEEEVAPNLDEPSAVVEDVPAFKVTDTPTVTLAEPKLTAPVTPDKPSLQKLNDTITNIKAAPVVRGKPYHVKKYFV